MHMEVISCFVKVSGVLCVIAGCTGIGYMKAGELSKRILWLKTFYEILLDMHNEIRYASVPVADIFLRISKHLEGEFKQFFETMARELEGKKGSDVYEIWEKNVIYYLQETPFWQEDLELINAIGRQIGYLDKKAQLSVLQMYMESLNQRILSLEKQLMPKKRMYESLGIVAGLMLALCLA